MFTNNPRIVTDGIKGCWDPLMPDTATSATLLYEQVGSGVDGTMYNGGCLDFDGSDDYVLFGSYTPGNGSWTVSMWVNADAFSNYTLLSNTSGSPVASAFYIETGGKISYSNYDGAPGWQYHFGGTTLSTGTWYLCTWVNYAGASASTATMKMFVNGVADSSEFGSVFTTNGGPVDAIGRQTGSYFNGKIADVKFYDVALSDANVKELYDDSKVIIPSGVSQTNLKRWWPMIDGGGTIAYDGSGNGKDGTLTNMDPATDWTREGGAPALITGFNRPLFFAGSDYLTTANIVVPAGGNNYTVSLWFNQYSQTSAAQEMIAQWSPSTSSNAFFLGTIATNNIRFSDNWNSVSIGSWAAKTWHHLAAVSTDSNAYLYLNGSLVATKGSALTYTGQDYLYIGKQGSLAGEYFLGLMNEVLVYDAALVLADIQALAATGPNGGPLPPDPYAVSYSAASTSNIIGYWRNDGNTNWIDRSSNSNDMTAVGALDARIFKQGYNGTASTSTGRDGQGFPLLCKNVGALGGNDSTYYTAIGNDTPTQIGGLGSLEAWVFPSEDKWMYFYWKGYNADNSLYLGYHAAAPDKWFFGSYYSASYKYFYWRGVGQSTYADFANKWHCLTMTFDKTLLSDNWKVYHNGVYADATDYTTDLGTSTHSVQVGGGGRYWVGQIGPIRLYDRVLSPSEITQNFNAQRSRFNI